MQNPLEARSALAVQRAQAQELPDAVLLAEVERRGYTVEPKPWPIELIQERAKRFADLLNASHLERDARGE